MVVVCPVCEWSIRHLRGGNPGCYYCCSAINYAPLVWSGEGGWVPHQVWKEAGKPAVLVCELRALAEFCAA